MLGLYEESYGFRVLGDLHRGPVKMLQHSQPFKHNFEIFLFHNFYAKNT